jgi:hypothetical protein
MTCWHVFNKTIVNENYMFPANIGTVRGMHFPDTLPVLLFVSQGAAGYTIRAYEAGPPLPARAHPGGVAGSPRVLCTRPAEGEAAQRSKRSELQAGPPGPERGGDFPQKTFTCRHEQPFL